MGIGQRAGAQGTPAASDVFARGSDAMCFAYDATPPDPPGDAWAAVAAGADANAFSGQELVLTSADGVQFAAYLARPSAPTGAAIVILPDVRGLYRFYKELADRYAVA